MAGGAFILPSPVLIWGEEGGGQGKELFSKESGQIPNSGNYDTLEVIVLDLSKV